jgi:hypothetical protein
MPDRKTWDERERYDHSGHPIGQSQPSDLNPAVQQPGDRRVDRDAVQPGAQADAEAREHAQRGTPEEDPTAAARGAESEAGAGGHGSDAQSSLDRHRPHRGAPTREGAG